jgi:uncharacterized YigZ family protein
LEDTITSYFTIKKYTSGIFKDKGSKFLSFAYPVKSETEIKSIVDSLKKEYFDARHHCYAYRLGAEMKNFRANDDGEPSGTAGKPILGQIQSYNLTNILIVVVRYFGGTLLGTSGLIQAYKHASIDAISQSEIIEVPVSSIYQVQFGYSVMNDVMKIIKEFNLEILNNNLNMNCSIDIRIKKENKEQILFKLSKIDSIDLILLTED